MALTAAQVADHATTALAEVKKGQEYFNNFLTVSTFGGDYMFQRLHTLDVALTNIKAGTNVAANVAAGEIAIDELQSYYNNFLTVSTFGGNYLFEILANIKKELDTIKG